MVMVQGDTTSTLAGAIAAFHHRVAVGHIEAGLRTGNADSPYPEEVNRRLVSQVARIHFAPTVSAGDNLVLEGVPRDAIHITGNTAVDALRLVLEAPSPTLNPALTDLIDDHRRLVLITTHRRESWGRALEAIADAVARLFQPWSMGVYRFDGEFFDLAASRGGLPGSEERFREISTRQRATRDSLPGRCLLDRATVHIADVESDPNVEREREFARRRGWRAVLQVPMLRDDQLAQLCQDLGLAKEAQAVIENVRSSPKVTPF